MRGTRWRKFDKQMFLVKLKLLIILLNSLRFNYFSIFSRNVIKFIKYFLSDGKKLYESFTVRYDKVQHKIPLLQTV